MSEYESNRPWWLLPPGRLHPVWWWAMAAALVAADYFLTTAKQFPVAHVIPVTLAAWYSGRRPAIAIAAVVPVAHLFGLVYLEHAATPGAITETVLRGFVIGLMGMWFARLARHERAREQYVDRLEGLLPICAFCKSIRNDSGRWEPLESYISDRSAAKFSHGFCPRCAD